MGRRYRIPRITNEELAELAKRIKPVMRGAGNKLFYGKIDPDLRGTSYTWNFKATKEATGLFEFATIRTLHTYGSPMLFKPSVAEVIAQIPREYCDRVVAFEITQRPVHSDDLIKERDALNAGFHVAVTALLTTVDESTLKIIQEKTECQCPQMTTTSAPTNT